MEKKISMKLLVNKESQKVLFAEADKEFVDFLFGLLALPIGSVVRLLKLKSHSMVGCAGKLYESLENLRETYIEPHQDKNLLLNPVSPSLTYGQTPPLLLEGDTSASSSSSLKFYTCSGSYHHAYVTDVFKSACPSCNREMTEERAYVANRGKNKTSEQGVGIVKGVVTYTVMDDLEVTPMSTISSITLLNKFKVKEVGALEELVVDVGMQEGLAILKASLQSDTVLSDIFLGTEMKKA